MPRINILKDKDINSFDSPPLFSEEERNKYFELPDNDIQFRKIEIKIGYILQEGYFKSRQKFFLPNQYHKVDIDYVIKLCGIKRKVEIDDYYSRAVHNIHKQFILDRYGYNSFSKSKSLFEKEAQELVKSSSRPEEMFSDLLNFLVDRKIEIPRYYVFAETITKSLNSFEKELIDAVDNTLTTEQKEILDGFMYLPADDNLEISSKNPYLITQLKKAEQATSPSKIKESLKDFRYIKELYDKLSDFYASDLLSNELINYYAVWVVKAEHIQFDAIRDIRNKRLYIISFISYQYKMRQDYFMDAFLSAVQKFYNDAEKNTALSFMNQDLKYKKQEQLTKVKDIVCRFANLWKIVFSNPGYDSDKKLELIKEVFRNGNFNPQDNLLKELDELGTAVAKNLKDLLLYEELNKTHKKLMIKVTKILSALEFNPQSSDPAIYKAIRYYQENEGKIKESNAPFEFIEKKEWKWLYSDTGEFNTGLYKVLLFKAVFDGIKSGELNLLFSERYQYVDDYLISQKRWDETRTELLVRAGLEELDKNPQEILDQLKVSLDNQYTLTNEDMAGNEYIKITPKGVVKVKTPKRSDSEESCTANFIGRENLVPLSKVLADIAHCVNYISSFTHYSRKNARRTPPSESIHAGIIALGCNIEVQKMGKISDGIGASLLEYAVRWFFSKNNIDDANSKIIAFINNLSLSNIYRDYEGQVNTSSDGQKFNVSVPSLNAGHSPKYFGAGIIVSAYSSIDAKGRLTFGDVHNPKYRESNFVLDALFHNPDVMSDTHATDTHGYTEIVFGICNLLGVYFTPRIKRYYEQVLYTFRDKPRKYYENKGYKILPGKSAFINEKIIIEQWTLILRFLCSIKLRETLPSNILKRLSSYSRQHPLHKALKEMGRIYKSCFLLRYYDELPLRQDIEKQLNRIELSHLFAKAVFFGGNQEFHYATKEEQDMVLGCRHLIQNAIVLWNYLYISQKLAEIEDPEERQKQIDLLKNGSIMTWQHVNMHGRYDFNREGNQIPFNMDKISTLNIS